MSLWDPAKGGSVENIIKTMVHRTLWCRRELSGGRGGRGGDPSRVFFNLRDFQHAWPSDPEKVLEIVSALSSLPPITPITRTSLPNIDPRTHTADCEVRGVGHSSSLLSLLPFWSSNMIPEGGRKNV